MAVIAALSGLGTLIPQNKGLEYYALNYPEDHPVLGFLSYNLLVGAQLDHIYSAWYFYLSIVLLGASLMACTWTTQWPTAKVAQRWRFIKTKEGIVKVGGAEVLPNARLADVGRILEDRNYQVFIKEGSLYAFKGLAGRLGPIGVHAALLLILFGTSYSSLGGLKGSVMVPEGQAFEVAPRLRPSSPIAFVPGSVKDSRVLVEDFTIDYREDGSVAQFYSTLSLLDERDTGDEDDAAQPSYPPLQTKKISVNDPFRFNGVTLYQTDWSLSAVTLRINPGASSSLPASSQESKDVSGSPTSSSETEGRVRLPFASLEGKPGISGRLWGTFLPLAAPGPNGEAPKGISILARDPQSVIIYDSVGKFVGVRRPDSGKPIEVEGLSLVVDGIVGATGLEIKTDPGVPWVYAGYGGLMITTLISYLSHSQVWALQQGSFVFLAGKSNRAVYQFEEELDRVKDAVPERVGSDP